MRRQRPWISIGCLVMIHAAALAAPFLAPYGYADQDRRAPWAPPSRVRFIDAEGNFHWRPFVYGLERQPNGDWSEDPGQRYSLRLLPQTESASRRAATWPGRRLFGVEEPGRIFLLGTDGLGRDQFSRVLYGARVSLLAGLAAALLSLSLGTLLGALAGYFRGWIDSLLMRLVELVLALPALYLLLGVRAFLPLDLSAFQSFLIVVLIIGLLGWAKPARLVRGVLLSARERGYVEAARGFGASDGYLLRRHLLPDTLDVVLTQAALLVPQFILAEVTLSFLGLGISEPVPSLGNMLSPLQRYSVLVSYWWAPFPAALLVVVILAYFALGEALKRRSGG